MISLGQLILDRAAAGLPVHNEFEALPHWQMYDRWDELSGICPFGIQPGLERRPANALNIEIGTPTKRCSLRSPDERGLLWIMSGGSPLAYGHCLMQECPKAAELAGKK